MPHKPSTTGRNLRVPIFLLCIMVLQCYLSQHKPFRDLLRHFESLLCNETKLLFPHSQRSTYYSVLRQDASVFFEKYSRSVISNSHFDAKTSEKCRPRNSSLVRKDVEVGRSTERRICITKLKERYISTIIVAPRMHVRYSQQNEDPCVFHLFTLQIGKKNLSQNSDRQPMIFRTICRPIRLATR